MCLSQDDILEAQGVPLSLFGNVNCDHLIKVLSGFSIVQLQFLFLQLIRKPWGDILSYANTLLLIRLSPLRIRAQWFLPKPIFTMMVTKVSFSILSLRPFLSIVSYPTFIYLITYLLLSVDSWFLSFKWFIIHLYQIILALKFLQIQPVETFSSWLLCGLFSSYLFFFFKYFIAFWPGS